MHHRLAPKHHRFEYGIFMALLDLDELDRLSGSLRLFGHNQARLYNFRDADHLQVAPTGGTAEQRPDLKTSVRTWLASQGVETQPDCRIRLLTLPRVFGYVFNPVSFYLVEGAAGNPLCAVAEVGNTFGELKPYLVPLAAAPDGKDSQGNTLAPSFRLVAPKHFYVSPFSDLELSFDFRLQSPAERLAIGINDVTDSGDTVLISALSGQRRPFSDRELLRLTARYPLVTLRVITLIHWHALKLWWKRVPWFRKADRPDRQVGVFRPHGSLRPVEPAAVPAFQPPAT
jgi:DUF1365 family protein